MRVSDRRNVNAITLTFVIERTFLTKRGDRAPSRDSGRSVRRESWSETTG